MLHDVTNFVDEDGDGKISIEELEKARLKAWHEINKRSSPVMDWLKKHYWAVDLTVGYTAVFYGGNFSHCFLCANSFSSAESETLKKNWGELVDETKETKEKIMANVGKDAIILEKNQSVSSGTLLGLLSCVDPQKIINLCRSMYQGFLIALCSSLNENAAKFGIGVELGDRITNFILNMADKYVENVKGKVEDEDEKKDDEEEEAKRKAKRNAAEVYAWTRLGLRAACTTIGLVVSWRLKDLAAVWTCCLWGGQKLAKSGFRALGHHDAMLEDMLGVALGWYGFAYHLRYLSYPPLPFYLGLPLAPMQLAETALRAMTIGNRS